MFRHYAFNESVCNSFLLFFFLEPSLTVNMKLNWAELHLVHWNGKPPCACSACSFIDIQSCSFVSRHVSMHSPWPVFPEIHIRATMLLFDDWTVHSRLGHQSVSFIFFFFFLVFCSLMHWGRKNIALQLTSNQIAFRFSQSVPSLHLHKPSQTYTNFGPSVRNTYYFIAIDCPPSPTHAVHVHTHTQFVIIKLQHSCKSYLQQVTL